jgi:hypothetical protein
MDALTHDLWLNFTDHQSSDNGLQRQTFPFLSVPRLSPCLAFSNSRLTNSITPALLLSLTQFLASTVHYQLWQNTRYIAIRQTCHIMLVRHCLTTNDRCAGALLCRRNLLFRVRFSGCFLLTAILRRWRILTYILSMKESLQHNLAFVLVYAEFLFLRRWFGFALTWLTFRLWVQQKAPICMDCILLCIIYRWV